MNKILAPAQMQNIGEIRYSGQNWEAAVDGTKTFFN